MPNGVGPDVPGNAFPLKLGALVGSLDRTAWENPDGRVELSGWNEGFDLNDGAEDDDAIIESRNGFGPPVI